MVSCVPVAAFREATNSRPNFGYGFHLTVSPMSTKPDVQFLILRWETVLSPLVLRILPGIFPFQTASTIDSQRVVNYCRLKQEFSVSNSLGNLEQYNSIPGSYY